MIACKIKIVKDDGSATEFWFPDILPGLRFAEKMSKTIEYEKIIMLQQVSEQLFVQTQTLFKRRKNK